jgi:hypothetical protein
VQRIESLHQSLLAPPRTYQDFSVLLDQFTDHVLLPVFCLDEFEILLKCGDPFTDSFFDRLRGCMNAGQLMFILASRRPLDVYAGDQNLTSAFFNLGHVVKLGEFSEEEAKELVGLPVDGESALNPEERQLALSWGGRNPYLLQMAGTVLFEAHQLEKSIRWAKKRFKEQQCRIKPVSVWKRGAGWILKKMRALPGHVKDCTAIVLFILLVSFIIAVGYAWWTGKLPWKDVLDILSKLVK